MLNQNKFTSSVHSFIMFRLKKYGISKKFKSMAVFETEDRWNTNWWSQVLTFGISTSHCLDPFSCLEELVLSTLLQCFKRCKFFEGQPCLLYSLKIAMLKSIYIWMSSAIRKSSRTFSLNLRLDEMKNAAKINTHCRFIEIIILLATIHSSRSPLNIYCRTLLNLTSFLKRFFDFFFQIIFIFK